ncbi:MAG: redoxin family protein [Fibrobacter sp.]|nr:redoxin family protein [Fibrobacter sp.]
MKKNKIALAAAALAFAACSQLDSAPKQAAINAQSTDDQKFAYMLGAQFGTQNLDGIPRQIGERLHLDVVVQAIRDNAKTTKDTSFKLPLTSDQLQAVGASYTKMARDRFESARPDSATQASFGGDGAKYGAYMDSVMKTWTITPAPKSTGAAVTVTAESADIVKFSYLIGLQFSSQLISVGNQFETSFDEDYFILGVKDAEAKLLDSNFVMQLPQDSLTALGQRFQQKMQEKREAAAKKFEEEQKKLQEDIAGLRGDTLANGMPKLMNFKVKATGITMKAEDLSAFAGKKLLMFYFSATCGHCAHAAPQILEIAKAFAKDGLTTVAVASGGNNKSGIRKFMDNAKWDETINVVWDETRQFGELYSDGYVPKVYVVNPDGTYKQYAAFENDKEAMKLDIQIVLNGQNVVWNPEPPKTEEAPAAAK